MDKKYNDLRDIIDSLTEENKKLKDKVDELETAIYLDKKGYEDKIMLLSNLVVANEEYEKSLKKQVEEYKKVNEEYQILNKKMKSFLIDLNYRSKDIFKEEVSDSKGETLENVN